MKRYLIYTLIVTVMVTSPLFAKDRWLELTSEHFILRTDEKPDKARQTIEDLEKFRFTLGALTGLDLRVENRPPLTIYAFRKTRDFQKQLATNKETLGFYYQRPEKAIAVLSLQDGNEAWQFKGLQIIFHEYSHHVLHHYSPFRYPKWYDEGFGEYLSTITFDGKIVTIGDPAVPRYIGLGDRNTWARIEDIIRARAAYPDKGRTRRGRKIDVKSRLYSQGWLLTHYLISKAEYKKPLNEYMRALNEPNTDDNTAFLGAFGKSYKDIEDELFAYWKKGAFSYLTYDLSSSMPDFGITVREMSDNEAKIQHDEVRHLTGNRAKKFKQARQSFKAALDVRIRPTDMRIYLAELALRDDKPKVAERYANDILQVEANNAAALQIKSKAFVHAKDPLKLEGQELTDYRSLVADALKVDKYYVPALLDYAKLYLYDGIDVTPNALDVAALARKLAPDNYTATSTHIALLWKSGNLAKARREAQLLIDWTASEKYKKQNKEFYKPLLETAVADKSADSD
jgi:hypothetical protein